MEVIQLIQLQNGTEREHHLQTGKETFSPLMFINHDECHAIVPLTYIDFPSMMFSYSYEC